MDCIRLECYATELPCIGGTTQEFSALRTGMHKVF